VGRRGRAVRIATVDVKHDRTVRVTISAGAIRASPATVCTAGEALRPARLRLRIWLRRMKIAEAPEAPEAWEGFALNVR